MDFREWNEVVNIFPPFFFFKIWKSGLIRPVVRILVVAGLRSIGPFVVWVLELRQRPEVRPGPAAIQKLGFENGGTTRPKRRREE